MADSRGRAGAGAASAARPDLAHVLAGRWRESRPALALWPWFRACLAYDVEQRRLVDQQQAESLVAKVPTICPYSKDARGKSTSSR